MAKATQAEQIKSLTRKIRKMERRLTEVSDRQGVLDAVNRYARGLDRHDPDLLASAYHTDAVDNHGDWVGYIPEFVPWGIERHTIFSGHTHNMTTHFAEIDGDTAHAESYVIFVLKLPDGKGARIGGGRYIDRLEKRKGEWRIMLRRMVNDWRFYIPDSGGWDSRGLATTPGRWDKQDVAYMRPLELSPEMAKKLVEKGKPPRA